jgi:hypothetical protein
VRRIIDASNYRALADVAPRGSWPRWFDRSDASEPLILGGIGVGLIT